MIPFVLQSTSPANPVLIGSSLNSLFTDPFSPRYVLTNSINVNQLVVDKRKVKVWGQIVTVNTSTFDFSLPLQNEVQREIYDFTNIIQDRE